jgi:geranylgeranyl diphosphate synthase type I
MDGPEILFKYRGQVEAEVLNVLRAERTQVDEMLAYQMGWNDGQLTHLGKCLRPTFFLLACESLGGNLKQALPIAVGIEFVHNFSLIHDDIEDGDDLRHHRATTWAQFGRDPAIIAGLALWNEAYSVIGTALDRGMPAERVLEARRILNQTCSEIIEGQHQDLSFETRNDVSLAEYIQMIGRKSAALFGTSLRLGALAAGASNDEASRFDTYGRQLGLAFQIRDDILGIWGEGSATGKPVGADIARRKKSLPVCTPSSRRSARTVSSCSMSTAARRSTTATSTTCSKSCSAGTAATSPRVSPRTIARRRWTRSRRRTSPGSSASTSTP